MKKRNLIVKGITAALVFCLVYGTTLIYHNEFKSFSVVALEDNSNWNEAINGTYCICPMYTVVNLRSDTSLNSDIVCSIPQGTNFTVTAVNGEWAKVEYNGKNGYIMYDHITKAVWDGSYDTSWYDDQDDKLYIFTAAELAGLAHLVNESGKNFDGITIYIENDIDLSGGKWTPIGEYPEKIFKGTFDCQNHSIKNIAFSYTAMNDGYVPKGSGLFGYCEGSIKNTTIDNCMISTSSNFYSAMGGVCGVLSNGSIENCVVSGIIKSSNYSSSSRHQLFVGGIVGDIQGVCTINQCKSTADVTIQGDDVVSAGGICGSVHGDSIINECASLGKTYSHATNGGGGYYADGSVAPQEQNYSGGICGKVYEGSLTIKNSYNQGKVESNSTDTDIKGNIHEYECSRAGGIIGELNKSSSIYDSYNTGEIIGYYSGAITVLREQETILENVYYLSSCCKIGIADGIDSSIAKSMLNLKKEAFVEKLGDKFTYSENNYPKATPHNCQTSKNMI